MANHDGCEWAKFSLFPETISLDHMWKNQTITSKFLFLFCIFMESCAQIAKKKKGEKEQNKVFSKYTLRCKAIIMRILWLRIAIDK